MANELIEERIKNIQDMIRKSKDNENITVEKYYEKYQFKTDSTILEISIAEINETPKGPKAKNSKESMKKIKTYQMIIKYKGKYEIIGEINDKGELILNSKNIENLKNIDPDGRMQLRSGQKINIDELEKSKADYSKDLDIDKDKSGKTGKNKTTELDKTKNEKKPGRTEIDLNRNITRKENFNQIIHNIDQYTNVYVDQGSTPTDFKIVGRKKDGTEELIPSLKQTKGKNPIQYILSLDSTR